MLAVGHKSQNLADTPTARLKACSWAIGMTYKNSFFNLAWIGRRQYYRPLRQERNLVPYCPGPVDGEPFVHN